MSPEERTSGKLREDVIVTDKWNVGGTEKPEANHFKRPMPLNPYEQVQKVFVQLRGG